jgi:hypothetical protein
MAAARFWILDVTWWYVTLIAAGFAAIVHLVLYLIAAIRIGTWKSSLLAIGVALWTFFACGITTIILTVSVSYAYEYTDADPSNSEVEWGIGFGAFYIGLRLVSVLVVR